MKKLFKLMIAAIFALTMFFSSVACNGNSGTIKIDDTKSQLYVENFGGGYGSEWLTAVTKRFEEAYANEVFEPGTIGVQIIPMPSKGAADVIRSEVSISDSDVFFNEWMYYYDFVQDGSLLDITDVVTEVLSEYGESRSIEDKMDIEQKTFLKTNGKYYAIPHYAGLNGIAYDIDLFELESLYFAKGGCPSEYSEFTQKNNDDAVSGTFSSFSFTDKGAKSAGPDGKYGTSDDGLPATYREFFAMCDLMSSKSITPIIWTGTHIADYTNWFLNALKADFEGGEQLNLNYSYNGTATTLVDRIVEDGSVTGKVYFKTAKEIENSNGYELYNQAGTYYALKFMEQIIEGGYYDKTYSFGTCSQKDAQKFFLESRYRSGSNSDVLPIAMLLDGIWWENEANEYFKKMANTYPGTGRYERNIGFMPMPKVSEDYIGTPRTLQEDHYSFAFVNKNVSKKEWKERLAKEFVKFCYTDQSLSEFTEVSSTPKALNYELEPSAYNSLSTYGQQVWDAFSTSDITYAYSTNPLYLSAASSMRLIFNFQTSSITCAAKTMKNDNKSALEIFNAIVNEKGSSYWTNNYKAFF